jgi:cytochrome c
MKASIVFLSLLAAPAAAQSLGAEMFEPCRTCHALERGAEALPGPNLAGLIGRRVAGDPAYDYSPVLQAARATGAVWTRERLDRYLAGPERMFPGTWMSWPPMSNAAERKALVDFLADPNSR